MKIKRIFQPLLVILLLLFSFYYTEKSIELIRETDPIMAQIKSTTDKYQVKSTNAQVIGDKIIPGKTGQTIDYEESYTKMKQYGTYNEALTTLKEVQPTISVDDYYDKYIVSGNNETKKVALVFKITTTTTPHQIINILKNTTTKATLFIDGLFLENNIDYIKTLQDFELELLSYDNKYEEIYFNSSLNYLNSITKKEARYCYSDYDQKEVIELCEKLKLHTILPTIKVGNHPYSEIKEKLTNSAIISIPINQTAEVELPSTINYLKSRGYSLVTLEELLSESLEK